MGRVGDRKAAEMAHVHKAEGAVVREYDHKAEARECAHKVLEVLEDRLQEQVQVVDSSKNAGDDLGKVDHRAEAGDAGTMVLLEGEVVDNPRAEALEGVLGLDTTWKEQGGKK